MTGVVHIAGNDVQVGPLLRPRCAWCGAVLVNYDLRRIGVTVDQLDPDGNFRPGTYPVGRLVEVADGAFWVLPHEDGAQLPANACGGLDSEVTA
jgi:hypothetical protein